jgi:hypothetical protein
MQGLIRRAAIFSLLAAILNVVVFMIATQVSGPLIVLMPTEMPVTLAQPFIFSLLLGILGSLGAGFIALRTAHPRRTWVRITIAAIIIYGVPPFLSAGVTTAIWFNVMHAVAGLCLIPAIAAQLPEGA